jgi:sugar phosphate isomerase/epimerase
MAHLSINELTTFRWTFEEDVAGYAAAGVEGIGVWRQKLADFGEDRGIELLLESGLSVSSLLWAGGFTGSDGKSFKESIEDAKDAIRLAGAMNAGCLIVYTGPRAGHTHNHARRLMRGALEEILPIAEDVDVDLALEPMHSGCAADWTFLTQFDEAIELVCSFSAPRLKLAFDTYHLCQNGSTLAKLRDFVDHIAIVQLGDAKEPPHGEPNRSPIGEGRLPLGEVVRTLEQSGYRGFYDIELMGEEIERADYQQLVAQSKQAFERLLVAEPEAR